MSTHNNGRDVAVGGNAMIGGDAHIHGNAHAHHNLVVDGWLDAKNIRGANRGIYLTVEDLMRYNPHPREGWFAGVGASSPFAAYVCRMGVWMPTGGTIAINVDMSSYTREVAFLRAEIQRLANIVANIINPSQPTDTATITVTANDSTMGTVAGGGTYAVGSSVVLVASPNVGYRFVGWSDGNTDNPRTKILVGDETLTAIFESTTPSTRYSVNVNVANGQSGLGSVNINGGDTSVMVDRGDSVTINAVANALHPGAYFVKWSDGSTAASRTITVSSNMTFTAEFAEVAEVIGGVVDSVRGSVLVTATRNGESVELDDIRIGDIITLTATQNSGYEFVGWVDGNGDSMTGETGNTITFAYDGTQPLEFYAVFSEVAQAVQHTVSVESDDNTMGSAVITYSGEDKPSVTVDEGTSVLLKATALEGYAFVCWKKGDEVLDWPFNHDLLVTEDATYTATFAADEPTPGTLPSGVYYGEMPASITGFTTKAEALISAITAAHVKAAVAGGNMVKAASLPITASDPAVVTTSAKKSYILALVPNGTNRVVKQYDGLSDYIPFSADEGQYANGDVTLVVDGTTYKLYGQYSAIADSQGVPITIV